MVHKLSDLRGMSYVLQHVKNPYAMNFTRIYFINMDIISSTEPSEIISNN
jgi:hypothetical protein